MMTQGWEELEIEKVRGSQEADGRPVWMRRRSCERAPEALGSGQVHFFLVGQ